MFVLKSKYNLVVDNNERLLTENERLNTLVMSLERKVTDLINQRNDAIDQLEKEIDNLNKWKEAHSELNDIYHEVSDKLQKVVKNNKNNIKSNKELRNQIKSFQELNIPDMLKLSKKELMTLEESYEPGNQAFYSSFVDRLSDRLKLIPNFDIEAFKVQCYDE